VGKPRQERRAAKMDKKPIIQQVKEILIAGGLSPIDFKHYTYADYMALAKQYGIKEEGD
jgi:hypothetical protein